MFQALRAGAVILLLLIGMVMVGYHPRARQPELTMPSLRDNRMMPRNTLRPSICCKQ
ncbi:MAG: hypothetical protein VX628_06780 [Cyanobacteriota bacterium]|nr:hypothetical protein [Cyanobacteriota bacterium]